jgi:hypothetical protein
MKQTALGALAIAWLVPYTLLNVLTDLLGLIVVPICLAGNLVVTRESRYLPITITTWSAAWAWLWGNEEDGIAAPWYIAANPRWPLWLTRFTWSAIRNRSNNLQRVKYLNCLVLPSQIHCTVWSWGFWCRQGLYAGGALYVGSVQINIGYGFLPIMTLPLLYEPGTRDVPRLGLHWGIGAIASDRAVIERHAAPNL